MNIYKSHELESTFIKIINPKKSNIILGVVYRHPAMDLNEFNDKYVNKLLDNKAKENKTIFLLGDFNIDLLKYDSQTPRNEFLDSLSSSMILPYILHPTRVTSHSKTLDNIFSNHISKEAICGSITSTISDHLPQFLIMPSIFSDPSSSRSIVYERSRSNFNKEEFILNYFEKYWDLILNVEKCNVYHSFENSLLNMNRMLEKHAPFKEVSKFS